MLHEVESALKQFINNQRRRKDSEFVIKDAVHYASNKTGFALKGQQVSSWLKKQNLAETYGHTWDEKTRIINTWKPTTR